MRIFQAGAALLCCAGALVPIGCGFNSSPADGLRFQAPPNWSSSPGIMGIMQFWRAPSDDRSVLMLFKSPKPMDAREVFSNSRLKDTLKDTRITSKRDVTICGNQPATYIEARSTSEKGDAENVDMAMTTLNGSTYFALYVRPLEAAANPQAEAALRQLCPKP